MTKLKLTLALLTGFAAFTPVFAQAGSFLTPHQKLVQEINHSYGTQFKVQGQSPSHTSSYRN